MKDRVNGLTFEKWVAEYVSEWRKLGSVISDMQPDNIRYGLCFGDFEAGKSPLESIRDEAEQADQL